MKFVLVASPNSQAQEVIQRCFQDECRVELTSTFEECVQLFEKKRFEYVFLDVGLMHDASAQNDYQTLLYSFWRVFPSAEIVILSSQEMIREAVKAVKAGASAYLVYPLDPNEVKLITENIDASARLHSELDYLRDQFWRGESLSLLRTNTEVMKEVFEKVRAVAPTESTVLLVGETGTGKSVVANLIHQHSSRREKQFISVHCGAIPDSLLESELFGHEKGAFTGAVRRKLGRFEIAHGGTIFLDEIGTISSAMQIKLLQIIQERTFQRVGGESVLKADVRIIAATNSDLKQMCDEGHFRQDLYYRLNVFPIEIPPLRERIADLTLLVESVLKKLSRFGTKEILAIAPEAFEALKRYPWPGNIRELENLIERGYILEKSPVLTRNSLPAELFESASDRDPERLDISFPLAEVRRQQIESVERRYLTQLLTLNAGSIKVSARAAGLGERQLNKLMTKYHLHKEDFKPSATSAKKSEL